MRLSREDHEAALAALPPGTTVLAEPEDANTVDAAAVLVTSCGSPVGYVPRVLSTGFRELMQSDPVRLTVVRIGDRTTPPHRRLMLDLDVSAPSGFLFDRAGDWEPLAL
jgi:hypothetical protein